MRSRGTDRGIEAGVLCLAWEASKGAAPRCMQRTVEIAT